MAPVSNSRRLGSSDFGALRINGQKQLPCRSLYAAVRRRDGFDRFFLTRLRAAQRSSMF